MNAGVLVIYLFAFLELRLLLWLLEEDRENVND